MRQSTTRKDRDWSLKDDEVLKSIPMACADEDAAVKFMERQRGWHKNAECPHCDSADVYPMTARDGSRNKRYLWRCRECNSQYTVRACTVLEDSKIPIRHWVFGFWAVCSSKKGVSALQIRRQTGMTHKSALFMLHRIRWALADDSPAPIGGDGRTLEADETYVGGKPRYPKTRAEQKKTGRGTTKRPVFALVERGGDVRIRHVQRVTAIDLGRVIAEQADLASRLVTDEWPAYKIVGKYFEGGHQWVTHKRREYARKDNPDVHSNTVESVFSLFKRGLNGTWHSVSDLHLHRYLSEFEFRWNTREDHDSERLTKALRAAVGKRLVYRRTA